MSSLRWHGRVAVALAFSGLVVGTHVAVASPGGAAATRGYRAQTLAWQPCAGQLAELECATVRVPLDYGSPDGPTMNVAISRLRTGSAAKRRGIMLLNPGGPGGGGVSMPLDMRSRFPRDVLEQYDLVGFDPRGVRGSDRVTCQAPQPQQHHRGKPVIQDAERRGIPARGPAQQPRVVQLRNVAHDYLDASRRPSVRLLPA
jgi:hypothetical protein